MTGVKRRTEDWRTLPWFDYQRNVYRLQKRIYQAARRGDWKRVHNLQRLLRRSWQQQGRCIGCGLRFTAGDVLEVHHQDGHHNNNRPANLVLLHAHCHDAAHGKRCE